jgi:hypothetical protein
VHDDLLDGQLCRFSELSGWTSQHCVFVAASTEKREPEGTRFVRATGASVWI